MNISGNSATRFLQRERDDDHDLFNRPAPILNLKGSALSVDIKHWHIDIFMPAMVHLNPEFQPVINA